MYNNIDRLREKLRREELCFEKTQAVMQGKDDLLILKESGDLKIMSFMPSQDKLIMSFSVNRMCEDPFLVLRMIRDLFPAVPFVITKDGTTGHQRADDDHGNKTIVTTDSPYLFVGKPLRHYSGNSNIRIQWYSHDTDVWVEMPDYSYVKSGSVHMDNALDGIWEPRYSGDKRPRISTPCLNVEKVIRFYGNDIWCYAHNNKEKFESLIFGQ